MTRYHNPNINDTQADLYFDAWIREITWLTEDWTQEEKEKLSKKLIEWCQTYPYLKENDRYNILHLEK